MSLPDDVRFALRSLVKHPGFTTVAVVTVALAIGGSTAIFSFVDGLLLRPLPYDEADRIVSVLERPARGGRNFTSTLNFLDWQRDNEVFDFMAAQARWPVTLTGVDEPTQLRGGQVSARFFDIFGIQAVHGRTFLSDEDQPGHERVVVLTHNVWVNRFGADPSIVGSTLLLDTEPHTVVGILPEGSAFDRGLTQVWRPLVFGPSTRTRDFRWLNSLARLREGVSLEQAQNHMDVIAARLAREFPESNRNRGVVVDRYADLLIDQEGQTAMLMLLTATGMVLLIGCANLANLALARGVARAREVAVRASLGAGRGRLIRQALTEHVLLAVSGGALGIALGYATMQGVLSRLPAGVVFPQEFTVTMNGHVLLFALALSLLTGVLFGLAPALEATKPDLARTLKEGGRGSSGHAPRTRLRDMLVVGEVALACVLLVGAGLTMRSFLETLTVELGFDSTNVLTMSLPVTTERFPEPGRLNLHLQELRAAVEAVPNVTGTALSCSPPLMGSCYTLPMLVDGRPATDPANRLAGFFKIVSPSYFSTLGLTLTRGRALSDRDGQGSPPVLVINERLAGRLFEDADPIGERLLLREIVPGRPELGPDIAWEVVGVVANEKMLGLTDDSSVGVYVSNEQSPVYGIVLIVRTRVDPLTLQPVITAAIQQVDPDQAVADLRTVDQIAELFLVGNRLGAILFGIFAGIALLLATIGIYGLLSYSVAQRTHELGVRATLGASANGLLWLVLGRGLALAGLGLVLGLAGALGLTRFMASLLYGIGAQDLATFVSVAAILAMVAGFACYLPARQATRIDPMAAMRCE